ncbi:hypothetical protein K8I85_13965 [bacterium]|nr:hypothetical protein [bacterium]
MSSRLRWVLLVAVTVALVSPSIGLGLERTSVAVQNDGDDLWRGGTSCSVSYWNTCTGWLWVWDGWSPQDMMGVTFETCCGNQESSTLESIGIYVYTGSPTGYGFTGTLEAWDADETLCPTGSAIWSMSWLPTPATQGPVVIPVGVAIPDSNVTVTFTNGTGVGAPVSLVTDHPAAGPTGPQSCGFCYPSTRTIHSFYFGSPSTVLCPGSTLNDGICDSEFWWTAVFSCTPTSVDARSWGTLKNLYR